MNYRIGQKVVCINDDWSWNLTDQCIVLRHPGNCLPVRDGIYTIRRITVSAFGFYEPLRLIGHTDVIFGKEFFRPLVTRPTDISTFKRLLVPGAKILVPA